MEIIINSVYEKFVPATSDEDYESLKLSIKENGLWVPLTVNQEGVLLDGHRRYKICHELGINPSMLIREFATKNDEIIFVGEANLKRRHLTPLQRIEIVIKLKPYYEELAKINLKKGGEGLPISTKVNSRHELAKMARVGHTMFDQGAKILQHTKEKEIDQINKGNITINKVHRNIIKKEKKEERNKIVRDTQIKLPKSIMLHNNEFQKLKIKPGSVSLIFTDPPYLTEDTPIFVDLAKTAMDVLKDGGSLLTYVNQFTKDEVIEIMKKAGLTKHWEIIIHQTGPSKLIFSKKILVTYKSILWFTKGTYDGEHVKDSITSEFQGKELHKWAQSTVESDYYIKYMTLENEIVYDPCMGQGTFGISAKKLKRQFIGCEKNKEHFETARRLISDAE